jgi:acetolactate synthase regulatory subunit
MKEKYKWQIECTHTPETIDRIMLPIRKRGITVSSLHYSQKSDSNATCVLEFEIEPAAVDRIYKNLVRLQDIIEVKTL